MTRTFPSLRAWLRRAGIALALLWLGAPAQAVEAPAPIRAGVLDLRGQGAADRAPALDLRGEWGFAWQRFIDPAIAGAPTALAAVPGSWNEITADGKAPGTDGYASYTLLVQCDPGQKLALLVPAQRTALLLYVNGELVARQGEPGKSADAARPAVGGRALLTEAHACPMRLVAHLSNFSHRAGGFVRAPVLGPRALLQAQRQQQLLQDTGLLAAYAVLGLIPIIFFFARRKDSTPALFGLFCLSQALYADMTGERVVLQLLGAETGWESYLRAEYLAWFATMALFALLVRKLFEAEFQLRAVRVLVGLCVAAAIAVVLLPARLYSHLAPFGQGLTVAIGLYVTWAVARAARRGRTGAPVLLGGMAFLLALVLLDVLQYNTGGSTRSFTPFGVLVFVLSPAVVLARRLARALNAEELRAVEQREKADLLVRTAKAGIYDWDTTREVVTYSARLKEILGFPADADTAGWPVFYDFIHPDERELVRTRFIQQMRECTVASGEMRHVPWEYRLRRADGSYVWVLAEAISLTGSDCRTLRYICAILDITERRAMAEGLKESRDRIAEQAGQLQLQNAALEDNARLREEVERMSRHDLKTPLNSIIGVARLLREDGRLAPAQVELLGVAERAGYRMLEMVNLSLGLFKMETGSYDFRPQAVNLAEVASRVTVDMRSHAQANKVEVRLEGDSRPVYARAEELLCYSLVANLLKNAVEATPAGGTVTLTLEAGEAVRVRIHNPGRVPPEVAAHFFDKYVTAGKSGGTGLGTYSARLMARVQEGELSMASGDEEGTTLTLVLKALPADALPVPGAGSEPRVAEAPSAGDFPARDVLVVDDDEFNRLIVRRYLPSPPFTVEQAVNGQAAIEAVARRWPHFIVIDMEMPVMDGVEAVTWIRRREALDQRAPCIIVMLSSNDDAHSVRRGMEAGVNRYMTKPVTREALLTVLHELDGSAPGPATTQGSTAAHDPPAPQDTVRVDADVAAQVPAFLDSRRAMVDAMAQALAAGDREQLRGLAHRAGGGLALYGFRWAASQSRKIELQAQAGEARLLGQDIALLHEHLQTVRVH
ncbi:MAG: response regulator [Burkholderiales bacterium]|nr:response regulator [Burkholderiales bacterium]